MTLRVAKYAGIFVSALVGVAGVILDLQDTQWAQVVVVLLIVMGASVAAWAQLLEWRREQSKEKAAAERALEEIRRSNQLLEEIRQAQQEVRRSQHPVRGMRIGFEVTLPDHAVLSGFKNQMRTMIDRFLESGRENEGQGEWEGITDEWDFGLSGVEDEHQRQTMREYMECIEFNASSRAAALCQDDYLPDLMIGSVIFKLQIHLHSDSIEDCWHEEFLPEREPDLEFVHVSHLSEGHHTFAFMRWTERFRVQSAMRRVDLDLGKAGRFTSILDFAGALVVARFDDVFLSPGEDELARPYFEARRQLELDQIEFAFTTGRKFSINGFRKVSGQDSQPCFIYLMPDSIDDILQMDGFG